MRESSQFAASERKSKFEENIVAQHVNHECIAFYTISTESVVRFRDKVAFTEYSTC